MSDLKAHGLRGPVRSVSERGGCERELTFSPSGDRLDTGERLRPWVTSVNYSTENGRKAKTEFLDLSDVPAGNGVGLPFDDEQQHAWSIPNPGEAIRTTLYDEHDRPLEMLIYDKEHNLLMNVVRIYDGRGRVSSEEQSVVSPRLFAQSQSGHTMPPEIQELLAKALGAHPSRISYKYDDQNRVIERTSRIGPGGSDRTVFEYNGHGDPSRHLNYSANYGDVPMDEHGNFAAPPPMPERLDTDAYFTYEYDAHGNWTSKTVRSGLEQAPWTSVETRSITYYS